MSRRTSHRILSEVKVEFRPDDDKYKENLYKGITKNISKGGVSAVFKKNIPQEQGILVFSLPNREVLFEIDCKCLSCIKENGEFICRLKFNRLSKMEYIRLTEFMQKEIDNNNIQEDRREKEDRRKRKLKLFEEKRKKLDRRLRLKKFTLFIDGHNYDTGKYEYFPIQSKLWTEPKKTFRTVVKLKRNEDIDNFEEYIYARYSVNDEETNKKAIMSAYRASKEFKNLSLASRRQIFDDIYKLLLKHKRDIIDLMIVEGHTIKLAEWEFFGMKSAYEKETLNFFKKGLIQNINSEGNEDVYIARKPDGVVCVAPPKNAPCSSSFLGVFSLLAGNTLVIKPPFKKPLSTIYLLKNVVGEALRINGAPKGSVNVVIGNSKKIMEEWLESEYVDDIIFFGRSDMGLDIGAKAYSKRKKAILELSGNDMMFVWKDCDLDKAVESLMDSFMGSTQVCMVPKKAIIHEKIFDLFVEKIVEKAKQIKPALPNKEHAVLTPVLKINDFFEYLHEALENNAELVLGGYRVNLNNKKDKDGVFITPTVITIPDIKSSKDLKCIMEENYFPLLPLVKVQGKSDEEIFEKMISLSNKNRYGLRISVWVNSDYYIRKFSKHINNCGLLRINLRHVGFSTGLSTHGGTGRTGGPYGEMNYVWQKTSHLQGISRFKT